LLGRLTRALPRLRANALARGIEERLGRDLGADPLAEDLDLDRPTRLGLAGRHIRVGDRAPDGVAVPAACHSPRDRAVDAHGLGAERDRKRIVEDEAHESTRRLRPLEERRAADEVALVELDGEPEPRLVRRLVRRDVAAPDPAAT